MILLGPNIVLRTNTQIWRFAFPVVRFLGLLQESNKCSVFEEEDGLSRKSLSWGPHEFLKLVCVRCIKGRLIVCFRQLSRISLASRMKFFGVGYRSFSCLPSVVLNSIGPLIISSQLANNSQLSIVDSTLFHHGTSASASSPIFADCMPSYNSHTHTPDHAQYLEQVFPRSRHYLILPIRCRRRR